MRSRRRLALFMAATTVGGGLAWGALSLKSSPAGAAKPVLIRRAHTGFYRPEPDKPIFILALGSDQGAERYQREGPMDRGRADSIHIIAINPKEKAGTIVGIPRDTFVSAAGFSGKINGAMAAGGPEKMVEVVETLSGVTIDYYVVTSFSGFEDMVNELGGVVVDVPYDIRDPRYSNADFDAGQQVLGGYQALALARNRHSARRGDFSRSENQGLILLGALRRARAETFKTPGKMLDYLRIFFKYVATDIGVDEALNLGLLAVRIQTPDVRNVVIEGILTTTTDGASIVQATQAAKDMMADVADDAILSDPTHGVAVTR